MVEFELGQVVATPAACALLERAGLSASELIRRHAAGDWGDLCAEDLRANTDVLVHGDRIFSAYSVNGARYYVITEHDRSSTCVLLAEEY